MKLELELNEKEIKNLHALMSVISSYDNPYQDVCKKVRNEITDFRDKRRM